MNQIDWNNVREYYLKCRSYKQTGAHFGISPDSIRTRCRREQWGQRTHLNTPADKESVQMNTEHPELNTAEHPASVQMNTGCSDLNTREHPDSVFPGLVLPMLPNAVSQEISEGQPWAAQVIPHEKLPDKAAYRAYITNAKTQDCLFSGIRGLVPNARVSRENAPALLIAVVADYDKVMTPEERAKKTAKLSVKPSFVAESYSGGTHAVWVLAKPIPLMPNAEMVRALQKVIVRELRLANAYGVLDLKAFNNPAQYYHAGWNWQVVDPNPVPEETTMLWFEEAMKKSDFRHQGTNIPLERVREEMEKRFPGRWSGDFVIGARGVRFWDSMADCPTAAVVCENGMVCFTGGFPFRSWEDIFGHEFIARFQADTIGKALSECYFINNSFYVRTDYPGEDGALTPAWQSLNRQNYETLAAERYGLSNKPQEDGSQSPVKEVVAKIIRHRSLPAACPFIYRKETIIHVQDEPRLNTSFLRVHEPDLSKGKSWGDGFPFVAAFMERIFPDVIQRDRFMAAWAYTYRNAYHGTPRNGHTIFIAGAVGGGKNFLSECLYGESMGGSADASEYVLGQTRFNDHLMSIGVWTCNDTVTRGDPRERATFAKALKKMSANYQHMCEGKFKKAAGIFWSGRIIVTLNTDPDSLQLLPDVELSNRDKISLFKTSDEPMRDTNAVAKAKAEMGALCAFLLNWEIPEHCVGDTRWGVRNYLHPELLAEAANSGSSASFREILSLFVNDMFTADARLMEISGSATWFLQQMMLQEGVKDMLRGEVNARSIGKRMSALASTGEFPLVFGRKASNRIWTVEREAFMRYWQNGNEEGEIDELCPF